MSLVKFTSTEVVAWSTESGLSQWHIDGVTWDAQSGLSQWHTTTSCCAADHHHHHHHHQCRRGRHSTWPERGEMQTGFSGGPGPQKATAAQPWGGFWPSTLHTARRRCQLKHNGFLCAARVQQRTVRFLIGRPRCAPACSTMMQTCRPPGQHVEPYSFSCNIISLLDLIFRLTLIFSLSYSYL